MFSKWNHCKQQSIMALGRPLERVLLGGSKRVKAKDKTSFWKIYFYQLTEEPISEQGERLASKLTFLRWDAMDRRGAQMLCSFSMGLQELLGLLQESKSQKRVKCSICVYIYHLIYIYMYILIVRISPSCEERSPQAAEGRQHTCESLIWILKWQTLLQHETMQPKVESCKNKFL